jgi:hypothetical protein
MESARRASAIHEKRTGRALRITEADVINEEMYEEINDLPTEYRRLNAHLQTQSADFDRRLLAYLSCQMATRQAVSNCWQNEPPQFDHRGTAYITPQEPVSHGPSPSPTSGGMINYRQAPYLPTTQDVPWRQQGHSVPVYAPAFDQQYPQSSFGSPPLGGRHNSLPVNSTLQPPYSSPVGPMDARGSDNMSRVDSAVDMARSPQHLKYRAPHNFNDPKFCPPSWQAQRGYPVAPLSTNLPLDGQQFFPGSPQAFNSNASHHNLHSPSQDFANRRYSYNPNGKQKSAPGSLPHLHSNPPISPDRASASSSPLWSDMNHPSGPPTTYGVALPQAFQEADATVPNGTFATNALENTSDAISPRNSTLQESAP